MSRPVAYVALRQFCEHDDRPRRALEDAGFEVRLNALGRRLKAEEMPAELRGADAVLAGVEPYAAALLAGLPRLRCISRCGIGTDAIDLPAAARHNITVFTTVEEIVEPVAQMTVAMILALARRLPQHLADFRAGQWTKHTGSLLSEWVIGLVGFGRIGQAVERYLRVFEPTILVADPALRPEQLPERAQRRALPALLAQADCVSLHAARDRAEGPLIGSSELAAMKPGAYLVNTARGFLVDQDALERSLAAGHLAGAALDVFEPEPYTGPLTRLPQVLCTPHVSTLTRSSRAAMEWRAARHIVECFARDHHDAQPPRGFAAAEGASL